MTIFAGILIVVLLYVIAAWLLQYKEKEKMFRASVKARLLHHKRIEKKEENSRGRLKNQEIFVLVFELKKGGTMEISVSEKYYRTIPKNVWGRLLFKGNRFFKFIPDKK